MKKILIIFLCFILFSGCTSFIDSAYSENQNSQKSIKTKSNNPEWKEIGDLSYKIKIEHNEDDFNNTKNDMVILELKDRMNKYADIYGFYFFYMGYPLYSGKHNI